MIGAHGPDIAHASWIENLRCPRCGSTGQAKLTEVSPFNNSFDLVPDGFTLFAGYHGGKDFRCAACNIPVVQ
jgi:hypothetical protein